MFKVNKVNLLSFVRGRFELHWLRLWSLNILDLILNRNLIYWLCLRRNNSRFLSTFKYDILYKIIDVIRSSINLRYLKVYNIWSNIAVTMPLHMLKICKEIIVFLFRYWFLVNGRSKWIISENIWSEWIVLEILLIVGTVMKLIKLAKISIEINLFLGISLLIYFIRGRWRWSLLCLLNWRRCFLISLEFYELILIDTV